MSARRNSLIRSTSGAVAPTVALSLFALIAAGGIAFDYARMAGLDTELQNAADQAALAAATQLDGEDDARTRATNAVKNLIQNNARFANDGCGVAVGVGTSTSLPAGCDTAGTLRFYQDREKTALATSDADAKFVEVEVNKRTANFALTPIVQVFSSGGIKALAFAGVGQAICKQPPVMICNPDEPIGNENEHLPFNAVAGQGMRLVTGDASAPGNFGWLESNIVDDKDVNGSPALFAALSYDTPPGECQPIDGVTTKTGMVAAALSSFNTRFDVFANGNPTCPGKPGGTCSPSINTRKDLVCKSSGGASCNANANWTESSKPYRPQSANFLPTDKSEDPDIMGYPRDLVHAVPSSSTTPIMGDGSWDRDAYFRVNYNWTHAQWTAALSDSITRYELYKWEIAHQSVQVSTTPPDYKGINIPQSLSGNDTAFGKPATGRSGIDPTISPIDRRKLSVAVLNCEALEAKGKTKNVPVAMWLDIFLVEPSFVRKGSFGGKKNEIFTEDKEIYAEVISATNVSASSSGSQVVLRSVPYLIE
ncbi:MULTISPECIES: pilus assembly protein TadG-related protein [Sphingobium]|uniref:pilus assembly protein TadG-related protein n=1 Tax=Sphingobium sp. MI1205 TaxID=407020 RepID=UPI00076FEF1A|nr:pilus assembly protein TadG-related protein [Sphingobium sp. MI1205]AMK18457.1 hypothetical protein K663_10395 [Sphingobium sp. MI1205]